MTIYGIELAIKPDGTSITYTTLVDSLDAVHDTLMAHQQVYSADIIASSGEVFLLLGVKVEPDSSPTPIFKDALDTALNASGLAPESISIDVVTPAKALVPA